MIVNQSALKSIFVGFNTIFNKVFSETETKYEKIATTVPSKTKEENYKWLGKIPSMREWIGDREIQNLSASDYTIKNKDYELTVGVDRNDIEDDTLGIYNPVVSDIAASTKTFPDKLVFGMLKEGFENKCYDGQVFFSEAHAVGKKKVSNKSNKKLTAESYAAARVAIMSLTDENGESLNLVPNLLVVPPALEGAALEILKRDTINGSTNIYKDTADILVAPELSGKDTAWYLLCTTKPLKPLIFQERKVPKFTSLTNDADENVFMRKEFLYGVDRRANAGYGFWQMAFGSTGEQA